MTDQRDELAAAATRERDALREAAEAAERDCRRFIEGTFDKVDEIMARQSLDALRAALAADAGKEEDRG